MWQISKKVLVGKGHRIVLPRIQNKPAMKPKAGSAWLVPLYFKRPLLLDEADLLNAWTLCYSDTPENWAFDHNHHQGLRFKVRVYVHSKDHSNSPSGHAFTIPDPVRERGWLPETGEGNSVICELGDDEINIWTISAYNIESKREEHS